VVRRPTLASSGPAGDRFATSTGKGRRPLKRISGCAAVESSCH